MPDLNTQKKREGLTQPVTPSKTGVAARRMFNSPERTKYDYTEGQQTFDKWGKALGVGALNAQAIDTRKGIESHERSMMDQEREADRDIADRRIAATIATITSNTKDADGNPTNPHFLDATLLNNLRSDEVTRYLGGKFNVTKAMKTQSGDQLYKVDVFTPDDKNELIQSFHGTTQNIVERLHAYQDPDAQIQMGNKVKESREDFERKLAFLKSDPSINELVAKGIPLNVIQSAISNGHSLGQSEKEVVARLLKSQTAADEKRETTATTAAAEEGRRAAKDKREATAQGINIRTGKLKYVTDSMNDWVKTVKGTTATPEEQIAKKTQLGIEYDEAVSGKKTVDNKITRVLKDPKTGDVVHLNAAGEEIKRIKGAKKSKDSSFVRRPIDFKGRQNAK